MRLRTASLRPRQYLGVDLLLTSYVTLSKHRSNSSSVAIVTRATPFMKEVWACSLTRDRNDGAQASTWVRKKLATIASVW